MGIFDGLMFWKKKEDTALGDNLALPESLPADIGAMPADELAGFPQQPRQFQQQPGFQEQPRMGSFQQKQSFTQNRDMELIAARLDAINAKLQSIEQRIAGLEKVAYGEQTEQPSYPRYSRYRRW